jgi:putative phosphonate catabolism associated alcohol dehydrogenase
MDAKIMKTGRAAVYETPNAPFVIREYPVRDVKSNEALVRISMSTICRSDIESYQGHRPNLCPGVLGHEIIGIIEQLGADITHDLRGDPLAIGERVTWTEYFQQGHSVYRDIYDMPQKSPGIRKYGHDLVEADPHFLGGFAEYCYILPGTGILKLPEAITDEEATPLNCGVATMISVTEAAKIEMGNVVVVQGLGLLGLYGCAIAKARGARMVIGLDTVDQRLKMAKKFGADETIDVAAINDDALVENIRDLCSMDGVDVVLEVCGFASAVPVGVRLLRTGGLYIIGGLANPGSDFTLDGSDILKRMITLKGVHNYHPRHLIQALDFVMANRSRFPFADIVDSKFSLDELDEAFAKADERSVLRAAIVP